MDWDLNIFGVSNLQPRELLWWPLSMLEDNMETKGSFTHFNGGTKCKDMGNLCWWTSWTNKPKRRKKKLEKQWTSLIRRFFIASLTNRYYSIRSSIQDHSWMIQSSRNTWLTTWIILKQIGEDHLGMDFQICGKFWKTRWTSWLRVITVRNLKKKNKKNKKEKNKKWSSLS